MRLEGVYKISPETAQSLGIKDWKKPSSLARFEGEIGENKIALYVPVATGMEEEHDLTLLELFQFVIKNLR